MQLTVESPWYLLLIPVWAGLGWLSLQVRLPLGYVPARKEPWRKLRAFLPGWGTALLGGIGSLALSEPVLHLRRETLCLPDTWVLWDISRSMRLTDLSPNRQAVALEKMVSAMEAVSCGRMGLIAFAAGAYAVLPLTDDREGFLFSLQQTLRLDPGEGTDLSAAVETALALSQRPVQLLVVSDGAHNVPGSASLSALAALARERGMVIHTVFVGGEGEQTFPQSLRLLSEQTGGTFQENSLSLTPLLTPRIQTHPYPLAPGVWLLVISGGLLMLAAMALGGWFNVLTA